MTNVIGHYLKHKTLINKVGVITADGPYPLGDHACVFTCMPALVQPSATGAMEDALYEIASMRLFAPLSFWIAPCRIRTTIMNFRPPLLGAAINWPVNCSRSIKLAGWPQHGGVMMTQGTLVDATIIERTQLYRRQRAATRSGDAIRPGKRHQWPALA